MTSSIRFGRVAGIEIGAHWTWLLVAAMVVWSLAAAVFPDSHPNLSSGAHAAMAVVAAGLFFASLLAHELGHALAARRDGVPIDGITLWVFGGVARLSAEPSSAASELRIAVAGPLVSLVLGLAGITLSLVAALPAAVDGVVRWVGSMNLLLLAFNLVPAFPLDGGRVLRAGLWQATGDMYRATRWAASAGRAFGAAFVAAGFVLAVFVGSLSGLWLALIGFFVMSAADAELGLVRANRSLSAVRVGDVMVADPVTVPADLPLDRFFDDVFMRHHHTAYPVVGREPLTMISHEPVGMISFRDALKVPREQWPATPVSQRMAPLEQVLVIDVDRPLADAVAELARDDLHRALIQRSGRLHGLLSMTDAASVLEAAGDARTPLHRPPRDPIGCRDTSSADATVVPAA